MERGYTFHKSGDYIPGAKDFSTSNWIESTTEYADIIKNDLTDDDWVAIFNALRRLEETRVHEAKVRAGARVAAKHEPLLPADPPTPPSNN